MPRRLSPHPFLTGFGALVAAVLVAQGASAWARPEANADAFEPCLYAYDAARAGQPRFEDFPARISAARPRAPRIVGRDAREFRTMIRDGSGVGVNFAGHETIVGWGCGERCLDWAVVDRSTGRVAFAPAWREVVTGNVDDRAPVDPSLATGIRGLLFQRDSRLLVLEGMPSEDRRRDGIHFLRWTGHGFVQVGFVHPPTCRR